MKPIVFYCYDPYSDWCYGFSNIITRLAGEYKDQADFDVLSGGMILPEEPTHFSLLAKHIGTSYPQVEEVTGVQFGESFLWHVFHPGDTDWFPDSTKPAVALCIFKEYHPGNAVSMAADLLYALNFEGRDLTDDEAYRHLLHQYGIPEQDFYEKLKSSDYREKAYYEFALIKHLKVSGFPSVLMQVSDSKFYLITTGYTVYETLKARLDKVLLELIPGEKGFEI